MKNKLATGAVALTGLLAVGLVAPQVNAFDDGAETDRSSQVEADVVVVRDEDTPDVALVDDEDDDDTFDTTADTTNDTTFDNTADTTFDTVDTTNDDTTNDDTTDDDTTNDDTTNDTFDTTDTRG